MTAFRPALAVAAGLVLATLPFLRYAAPIPGEAHADHEPRYGGQLGMVGEHHVELRRRGLVEVFVSDAWRRPVRPRQGWVSFDGAAPQPLSWEGHRLRAADIPAARDVDVVVVLAGGQRLAIGFDFAPE